ncbi:MAG TPA: Uma2 family endonuclease, partial [Spirochaetes bacterium]|nr:Uma2 family endonuclease [Spirochaetota bacterium]
EGKGPDLVIELLSKSTKKIDQNEKKWIYQDKLKVPEYFWYDPWTDEWAGFRLTEGAYESIQEDQDNHLISRKLNLALCQWEGLYQDVDSTWLRWCDTEGNLLLLLSEKERHRANIEHLRANQERQRADQERQRADRLVEQLKNLGVNPDDSL